MQTSHNSWSSARNAEAPTSSCFQAKYSIEHRKLMKWFFVGQPHWMKMVWRGDVVVGVNDASGCDDMLKACREAPHQAACAPCTLRQAFPQDCLMLPVLTVLCGNTKIIRR